MGLKLSLCICPHHDGSDSVIQLHLHRASAGALSTPSLHSKCSAEYKDMTKTVCSRTMAHLSLVCLVMGVLIGSVAFASTAVLIKFQPRPSAVSSAFQSCVSCNSTICPWAWRRSQDVVPCRTLVDSPDDGNGNGISWRSLSHNQAFIPKKKKLPNHFAVRTSECSWRATVAPAGWTSSGLRAPHTGGWAGGPMAPVVATG